MEHSGSPITDSEYLQRKEQELEHMLQRIVSLQGLIAALRSHVQQPNNHPFEEHQETRTKRPSRTDRVVILLQSGPKTMEELAQIFKIGKREMRNWMEERTGAGGLWRKEGDGYALKNPSPL